MLLQRQVIVIAVVFVCVIPVHAKDADTGLHIHVNFLVDVDNPTLCNSGKLNIKISLYNLLSTQVVIWCSRSPGNEIYKEDHKAYKFLVKKNTGDSRPVYIDSMDFSYLPVSDSSNDTSWHSIPFPIRRVALRSKEYCQVGVEVPSPDKPGDYIAVFRLRPSVSADKIIESFVPSMPHLTCGELPSQFTTRVHVEECRGKTG